MSYTALYRKFRPDNFDDVKGQDHIVRTLKNQIKSKRLGHAYLFTGTRGTGKTTVAKILAKTVNCENQKDGGPCGECSSCKAIAAGTSMNVIEMDAASNNGVENVRQIVEEISYPPVSGEYKVYIVDEVHMLSGSAFNALLKTLEEPPSYVIFILATTEVHKIPITILSRCQRYDFRRITVDTITNRLAELMKEEGIDAEYEALRFVAKAGDGSMRDALSLLDRCIALYYGETLTYEKVLEVLGAVDINIFAELFGLIDNLDVRGAIEKLEEIVLDGRELGQFVSDFLSFLRNLLLCKLSDNAESLIDMSAENLQTLKELAQRVDEKQISRYIRVLAETSDKMKYATQKRIILETAIIKLCVPQMEKTPDSLIDQVRVLQKKLDSGQFITTSAVNLGGQLNTTDNKTGMTKEEYEKKVPGNIQKVNELWDTVVKKSREISPDVGIAVKQAKRHVNTETEELIVYVDPKPNYFVLDRENTNGERNYNKLIEVIEEVAGGEIKVEIKTLSPENSTIKPGTTDISDMVSAVGIDTDEDFEDSDEYEDD